MFPENEIHVMIDFETLGLRPNANVRSIGAVMFSLQICTYDNGHASNFYAEISLDTPQAKRYIDLDTWRWWGEQAKLGNEMPDGTTILPTATQEFDRWLRRVAPDPGKLILWSNGTDFDIPILYSIYDEADIKPYWSYNNVRDYRTLRKTFPHVEADPFKGVKHNAGYDAWNEAAHCVKILDYIRSNLNG